ncbi:ATP-binding cassette domain-containing protein [Curtobacterium flaccumfaciens]|nr:ATP-binding cassette domain-containing protein [Curtobacterium flaccumfaciens]
MSGGLRAHVVVPERGVDVRLDVGPDECVALIGPNGAGKSTIVETIAGLLRLRSGSIVLGDRVLTGVPAHRRRIGLVAQRADLFPHLSVAHNVAYGPRASGTGGLEARHRSAAALAAVGVAGLADRAPATLSGGQAQRVALARALATDPALLLLDEPTSALDVDARAEVRAALRTTRTGRPTLLVTHDPLEAVTLADRVVVLERGSVVEQGATATVLGRPTSAFAASFSGLTLVHGTATADGIALDAGASWRPGNTPRLPSPEPPVWPPDARPSPSTTRRPPSCRAAAPGRSGPSARSSRGTVSCGCVRATSSPTSRCRSQRASTSPRGADPDRGPGRRGDGVRAGSRSRRPSLTVSLRRTAA